MLYGCCCVVVIFFFKQKTAYEMRISDWSSDVCSSDLHLRILGKRAVSDGEVAAAQVDHRREAQVDATGEHFAGHDPGVLPRALERGGRIGGVRSEEHTSELQSLMRISYAVFCLKKKK